MVAYHVIVEDGSEIVDTTHQEWTTELPTYRVLSPIFKNGREFQPDEIIKMDPNTAQGFLALGEIEEATP